MPQPLKKPTKLKFGPDALQQRPELAAFIIGIINKWTVVEFGASAMLGLLLHILPPVSFALYFSTASLPLRLELMKASARSTLPDESAELVAELADKIRKRSSERNKIIHAEWAVSDDYPDALIRLEPSVIYPAWFFTAQPMILKKESRDVDLDQIFKDALQETTEGKEVWKKRDFEGTRKRLDELYKEIGTIADAISPIKRPTGK